MITFMFTCFIAKGFGQTSSSGSPSISARPVTKSLSSTTMPSFSSTTMPSFSPTLSPSFSSTVSSSFSPSITQSASLSYVYTSTYITWPSSSFSPSISLNPTYSCAPLISSSPSVSSTMSQSVYVFPISPSTGPQPAPAASPNQWFDSLANYQQMLVAFAMLVGGCICFVLLYNCYLKLTNPPNVSKPVITKNILGRGYEHQNVRTIFSTV